jgi:hypothetical protein
VTCLDLLWVVSGTNPLSALLCQGCIGRNLEPCSSSECNSLVVEAFWEAKTASVCYTLKTALLPRTAMLSCHLTTRHLTTTRSTAASLPVATGGTCGCKRVTVC